MRGLFITFEGGEGSGKSTQIKRLAARLAGVSDHPVTVTREPGGCPEAEEIRALLLRGEVARWDKVTETLLATAARAEHVARLVRPKLAEGHIILCDRFYDSTAAYQGTGLGQDRHRVMELQRWALGDLEPDLTLVLDIPVEIGLARATKREDDVNKASGQAKEDRYERMGHAFHETIRQTYLEIAKENPVRCRVIDANVDEDTLEERIWRTVQDYLEAKNG